MSETLLHPAAIAATLAPSHPGAVTVTRQGRLTLSSLTEGAGTGEAAAPAEGLAEDRREGLAVNYRKVMLWKTASSQRWRKHNSLNRRKLADTPLAPP
ncbi:MAG: hypothetical protein WA885_11160 [Phormidesmis sp.]